MIKYTKIRIDRTFPKNDFFENLKEFLKDKNLIFMFTKGCIKYKYDEKLQGLCDPNEVDCDPNELEEVALSSESLSKINDAKKYFYGYKEGDDLEDDEVLHEITLNTSEFFLTKNDEQLSMFLRFDICNYCIITDKSNILTNVLFTFEDDEFDFFWIGYTEKSNFKEYLNKTPNLLKQIID